MKSLKKVVPFKNYNGFEYLLNENFNKMLSYSCGFNINNT